MASVTNKTDKLTAENFNEFLQQNAAVIEKITPTNPKLSKDDEWRTGDYAEYDRGNVQ